MELFNNVSVCEGVGWFPGQLLVSCQHIKVLEFEMADAGVDNFLIKLLFFAVDNNRWRMRVFLSRNRVRDSKLKEGDVEDRMEFHGGRKVKFIRIGKELLEDFESVQFLVVQFRRGASYVDKPPM